MLTEIMMKQIKYFIHRSFAMRSSVSAKDVLLQHAAMMEKDPDRLAWRRSQDQLPGVMSQLCLPKSYDTSIEMKTPNVMYASL